jgi:glycosyltransferase involved in cell wall biosynthesis
VKGLADLISGFALFAVGRPSARLVIAGPIDAGERDRWSAYAAECAPEADIQITGHVSAGRYAGLIAAADVAVQLRLVSNGEASATIADCLAGGLPTLVSDLGWARELPADAVSRLRLGATVVELAERLEQLVSDPALHTSLSAGGLAHARANTFAKAARGYMEALELD